MKKVIVLILITFLECPSMFGQSAENSLSTIQKTYILSRFCTEVKYNFVYYDKIKLDWDSLCVANLPLLTQTSTDNDFMNGLKHLCAQLHDGHTYIFSQNNPKNTNDWIRPLPMKTKRIGDRVFVTGVYNSSLRDQGLCAGCEVLEIDGEKVLDYARNHIQPYIASSTPQWTEYVPFKEYELTQDKGSKVSNILFRNAKGKTFSISSNRNVKWDLPKDSLALDYKMVGKNIGLLTIRSFQRGEFTTAMFDKIFKELSGTSGLIIDVRDNGGGNSGFADYVISHFSSKPIPRGNWRSPMYIAAHASWHYAPEWYMQPGEPIDPAENVKIYNKPVVLLVNAGTFSSAENFCVAFKGARRGKIIGSKTAGSTGNPISIDLGFGVGCRICTRQEWDADGNEFVGKGITPDVEVAESPDIFLKNKDNLIEAAMKDISWATKCLR